MGLEGGKSSVNSDEKWPFGRVGLVVGIIILKYTLCSLLVNRSRIKGVAILSELTEMINCY